MREVYARLKAEGFEPWLDEKDLIPGQLWEKEIPKALNASALVLIFFSRKSLLLPVWLFSFHYKQNVYRIIANAQTSRVVGERPWSLTKITLAVLVIALTITIATIAMYLR